jgi:transposase-like protein
MTSVLNAEYFQNEEVAYAKLESIVWPHGPVCPHCGTIERMKRMGGAATRPGLYKCYACRKQSRVTVGTVFESSHVKLHAWLQAVYLMCSTKKGISSNQLARVLDVTIKTGWFISQRIREAMRSGALAPMGGAGAIVELDETFIGKKKGVPVKHGAAHKHAVLTLVERGKGSRSFHVDGTSAADIMPIMKANIDAETVIMTDEAGQYSRVYQHFAAHGFTRHSAGEYVPGETHTITVEGFYSMFKRGMKGLYQHCSEKHLHRYVAEFDSRYNNRIHLGVDDAQCTESALNGIKKKRLTYRHSSGLIG